MQRAVRKGGRRSNRVRAAERGVLAARTADGVASDRVHDVVRAARSAGCLPPERIGRRPLHSCLTIKRGASATAPAPRLAGRIAPFASCRGTRDREMIKYEFCSVQLLFTLPSFQLPLVTDDPSPWFWWSTCQWLGYLTYINIYIFEIFN